MVQELPVRVVPPLVTDESNAPGVAAVGIKRTDEASDGPPLVYW